MTAQPRCPVAMRPVFWSLAMALLWPGPTLLLAATFQVGPSDEAGLIDAINAANATPQPDIIDLAQSTYTFLVPDNLHDGPNALPSIVTNIQINGNGATLQRGTLAEEDLRLLHVAATGTLHVDDLTITGGWLEEPQTALGDRGGAIYSVGRLMLSNSRLLRNRAYHGGAIMARGGRIDILSTTFEANSTDHDNGGGGAGLMAVKTEGEITDSTFRENAARLNGGAVTIQLDEQQTFLVHDSRFELNRTDGSTGGAVYILGGSVSFDAARFTRNTAFVGGAISAYSSEVSVRNSTFTANANGALRAWVGGLRIESSTFNANRGGEQFPFYEIAGGVTAPATAVQIVNSTFSGNLGGALISGDPDIVSSTANVTVVNTTITGGTASNDFAGGVTNYPNGTLNLINTIVANSSNGLDCVNYGAIGANSGNLIEDGSCAPAYIGDPRLEALASNGGSTMTHAPLAGSPVLDALDPNSCPAVDQRGVHRPIGPRCDIGAYEGTKLAHDPIRVGYQTKPRPYFVVCDPLRPESIPVDILGSERIAADSVMPDTVTLASAAAGTGRLIGIRDVNGDLIPDLTMEWDLRGVYEGLDCTRTTRLRMEGMTRSAQSFFAEIEVAPVRK